MNLTIPEWAGIAALITALVGIYLAKTNRDLMKSDSAEKIQAAATGLIEPLEKRIDDLELANAVLEGKWQDERRRRIELQEQNRLVRERMESQFQLSAGTIELLETKVDDQHREIEALTARVAELSKENERLRQGVGVLVDQLRDNGLHPAWSPNNES